MPCAGTYRISLGDPGTIEPLNAIVLRDGGPLDWTGKTAKVLVESESGTVVLNEVTTGVEAHPTQEFTAEADDDLLTCRGHGVQDGDQIVVANSGGALPTGLSASTPYIAVQVTANKFALATLPGGQPINITADGSGTQTFHIVGSVQFALTASDFTSAGNYRLWFVALDGSNKFHYPVGQDYFALRVENLGN